MPPGIVIDIGARPLSEFLQPHPCEIGRGAYEIIVKVDIRTHYRYLLLERIYQGSENGRASCSNVQADRGCVWRYQ